MAISIEEKFQVRAPIDVVWQFLMDPHRVVVCMPGAELEEVVDEQTFLGNIKVKVGPIATSYKGRIQFTEVDEAAHTVRMVAEGRESGGGMAKGTMSSRLQALPDGQTEVVAVAEIDITGRIMQFGRGMIQDVSKQLFQQFVECAKQQLEALPAASGGPESPAASRDEKSPAEAAARETEPIRVVPLVLQALGSALARTFNRLRGRSPK